MSPVVGGRTARGVPGAQLESHILPSTPVAFEVPISHVLLLQLPVPRMHEATNFPSYRGFWGQGAASCSRYCDIDLCTRLYCIAASNRKQGMQRLGTKKTLYHSSGWF